MSAEHSRWDDLDLLQAEYPTFQPFLYDVMTSLMGFECSAVQLDIAEYLETGPLFRMIQAQRGQAKTTIAAAYAAWRLIHNPRARIMIVSAGGDMATEIANWVIQIIMGMDILECMRPDRAAGDRSSVSAFDIHRELKGAEKSPSIACMGITSNIQGKRADILIADDIESSKNSQTEGMRERLRHLTKDFSSINSHGDIIYLGTPQSIDSVYNGLVSRGFDIRIWPGRYPTETEQKNYGKCLAPMIVDAMAADPSLRTGGGPTGLRGQVTDDVLLPEATLTKKEIDQGAAYFQLQHMLDTRLSDADRFPLKSDKVVFMKISDTRAPLEINFQASAQTRIRLPNDYPVEIDVYRAASFGEEFGDFQGCHMYVDPSGGGANGDETAYAVTKFSAGRVFVLACGYVKGGLELESLEQLTEVAVKWKPTMIHVEKNFGNGALASVWRPLLLAKVKCGVEDVWESGQKELRIIDVLLPIIGSQRLVVDESLLDSDWAICQQYPSERRASYSLFYQMFRITRDKNSLKHDDRLDALAGSCRYWVADLAQDSLKAINRSKASAYKRLIASPLGDGVAVPAYALMRGVVKKQPTAINRMRRKV